MPKALARFLVRSSIAAASLGGLAACGASTPSVNPGGLCSGQCGDPPLAPSASPFSLYTHCGINEIRLGSHYYLAEKPLSDGQGNPPPGWNNPEQQGTITIVSASTAVFQDSRNHRVTFRIRPGATGYLHICS